MSNVLTKGVVRVFVGLLLTLSLFLAVPSISTNEALAEGSIVGVNITQGASTKTDDAYAPNPVHANIGDTVVWTNKDSTIHTATSGNPSDGPTGLFGGSAFAPSLIAPATKQSFTFFEAGDYPYYCVLHPTMAGSVIVEDSRGITVKTDKPVYDFGEEITVSGKVSDVLKDEHVIVRVANDEGIPIRVDPVEVNSDGRFSYHIVVGGALFHKGAVHSVTVTYSDAEATTTFRISGDSSDETCQGLLPTLVGTERNDILNGTKGPDVIVGLRGNDVINGLGGNDIICGGLGMDSINGGDGDDKLLGGNENDLIDGNAGNDLIWGGTGWDRLFGGLGNDTVRGGIGNDRLLGGDGNDSLFGQEGDDFIDGVPENNNPSRQIEISIDDYYYSPGDDVSIYGMVEDLEFGFEEATLKVIYPDGASEEEEIELDDGGDFEFEHTLDDDAEDGIYVGQVSYLGQSAFSYFLVDEEEDLTSLEIEENVYSPNETVRVFGEITGHHGEDMVRITVLDPTGKRIVDNELAETDADSFEYEFELDSLEGRYAVAAVSDGERGFGVFDVISDRSHGSSTGLEVSDTEPDPGDEIAISGRIEGAEEGEDIEITVYEPDNTENDVLDVVIENDGEFSIEYDIPDPTDEGIYTIEVQFGTNDPMFGYFLIDEDDDDISVVTDADTYEPGQEVEISGEVADPQTGEEEVDILVFDPEGNEIGPGSVDLEDSDEFEESIELDEDAVSGTYAVIIEYDGEEGGWAIFEVEGDDANNREPIIIELSKASYKQGEEVIISGSLDEIEVGEEVLIIVDDPNGDELFSDSIEPANSGEFEFEFDLDDDAETGVYSVVVEYLDHDIEEAFSVTSSSVGGGTPGNDGGLTAKLSKTSLFAGETLFIRGVVPRIVADEDGVSITILNPDRGFVAAKFPEPESDRSYSTSIVLPSPLEVGEDYEVIVYYDSNEVEISFDIIGKAPTGDAITVETDKASYAAGSTVTITGKVSGDTLEPGQDVFLRVFNQESAPYRFDPITPDTDGSYSYSMVVGGPLGVTGEWYVKVSYGDESADTTFLLTGGISPLIES